MNRAAGARVVQLRSQLAALSAHPLTACTAISHGTPGQTTYAFFPLYPLAIQARLSAPR